MLHEVETLWHSFRAKNAQSLKIQKSLQEFELGLGGYCVLNATTIQPTHTYSSQITKLT